MAARCSRAAAASSSRATNDSKAPATTPFCTTASAISSCITPTTPSTRARRTCGFHPSTGRRKAGRAHNSRSRNESIQEKMDRQRDAGRLRRHRRIGHRACRGHGTGQRIGDHSRRSARAGDQSEHLRPVRRTSRRRHLRRRVGRREVHDPEHQRLPQRRHRGAQEAEGAGGALAGRLLRRRIPLARRHRRRATSAR